MSEHACKTGETGEEITFGVLYTYEFNIQRRVVNGYSISVDARSVHIMHLENRSIRIAAAAADAYICVHTY